jgi:hypothetical protein
MRKIRRFVKCNWVVIWLVAAALVFSSVVTYAAFTYHNYAKTVARINAGGGLQFSSNYLISEDITTAAFANTQSYSSNIKYVYYTAASDGEAQAADQNASITFSVCNYTQGNKSSFNLSNIKYDVYAQVQMKDGSELTDEYLSGKCVLINGTTTVSLTAAEMKVFSGELKSATATSDSYELKVDASIADKIEVYIEVRPDSADEKSLNATDRRMLARRFWFSAYSTGVNPWKAEFAEESGSYAPYYGYNCTLSGSNETTIELRWNAEKITLGKWWLDYFGATVEDFTVTEKKGDETVSTKWQKITIKVGTDGITSYDLQFYRAADNTSTSAPENAWVEVVEKTAQEDTTDKTENTDNTEQTEPTNETEKTEQTD